MAKTLEMINALLMLGTWMLKRPRTRVYGHTHTCYKRGRTKCRFGAPFMQVPRLGSQCCSPPLADEASDAEKRKREHLKHHYETMHSAFDNGEFESLDALLDKFGVESDADYADVLEAVDVLDGNRSESLYEEQAERTAKTRRQYNFVYDDEIVNDLLEQYRHDHDE
ncbi:hypothetical protein MRX96_049267 [Rhipicephalus microplus]